MEASTTLGQAKRGLTASQLKTIAIIAMVLDHTAAAFVPFGTPLYLVMRFIGRITGPTMFYFIAEGYRYTRNANRYTLRLGIFALVSYLPFYYFEFGNLPSFQSFSPVGVIYSLFLALLALRARHEIQSSVLKVLAIAALIALSIFGDWPLYGVIMTLLFDSFKGNYKKQVISVGLVFLTILLPPFFMLLSPNPPADLGLQLMGVTFVQSGLALPLVLLGFYNGQRGKGGAFSKWFFYIIYPLHLLIIGLIKFQL